ncbi:MAG: hypothetical protein R2939_11220 [Kofleriaceae bacterium]
MRIVLSLALAATAVALDPPAAVAEVQVGAEVRVQGQVNTQPRYRRRPGPRYMLPLKVDLGVLGAGSDRGGLAGAELAIGIHWASLSPQPTNFDIGVGVFGGGMAPINGDTGARGSADDDVVFGGAYLEVGQTLSRGSFWRTWAAGRGEYMSVDAFDRSQIGLGAAARLSAELYLSGVGIEPRGLFLGTYAIGLYVEGGARDLGDAVSLVQLSGGLTFRTPLVWMP